MEGTPTYMPEASTEANPEPTNPEGVGQQEPQGGQEPQPQGEPLFTVDLDGEQVPVTLEEAKQGFLRQQDYTRKTQELSAERERLKNADALWTAFETDPQDTLQQLASAYQVPLGAQEQPQDNHDDPYSDDYVDPGDQRIQELEQRLAAQEKKALQDTVQSELDRLQQDYGDFDPSELLQHALKKQIPDLELAYRDLKWEERNSAYSEFNKLSSQQEEQAVEEAKRQASIVNGGSSTQTKTVVPGADKPAKTIRDAWELSKQQLGMSWD